MIVDRHGLRLINTIGESVWRKCCHMLNNAKVVYSTCYSVGQLWNFAHKQFPLCLICKRTHSEVKTCLIKNVNFIYSRKFGKCANCEKLFESSPPVLLPCEHRICREECFSLIQMTEEQKLCPVNNCSQRIPETFDENETPEDQKYEIFLLIHANEI